MKRVIVLLLVSILIVGCKNNITVNEVVDNFFNEYISLSDSVLKDIDNIVTKEELTLEQGNIYKDVLKRTYRDLNYDILNISYNDDIATITIKISTYDYYYVEKYCKEYLTNHQYEFLTNGYYDPDKYLLYKLNEMKNNNIRVEYNIILKCYKEGNLWILEQPEEETLEKIHGIYNYDLS